MAVAALRAWDLAYTTCVWEELDQVVANSYLDPFVFTFNVCDTTQLHTNWTTMAVTSCDNRVFPNIHKNNCSKR
jgi:hypothetical protein